MSWVPRWPTTSLSQDSSGTVWETQPQLYLLNTGKPVFPEIGQEVPCWGLMSHGKYLILLGFVLYITKKAILAQESLLPHSPPKKQQTLGFSDLEG